MSAACETNSDCKAAGLFCDSNKQCKPSPPIMAAVCSSNSNCGSGRICRRGACVAPSLFEDILLGQAACKTKNDCNNGFNCVRGKCVKPSMITNEDQTEEISNAERFKGLMCMEDYQCGDLSLVCIRGNCGYARVE